MVSFPSDILPSLIIVKEPEGVAQMSSVKRLFLKISQNSQENTCLKKLKNELKIYIIYICDFGIDISITERIIF